MTTGFGRAALRECLRRPPNITPGNYGAEPVRPGYGPQAAGLQETVRRLA
ncbi:hypothetical protein [Luteitalea sp. TBR-22]|nr:hypothetical protein [Luteitalea sp. TBR-22]